MRPDSCAVLSASSNSARSRLPVSSRSARAKHSTAALEAESTTLSSTLAPLASPPSRSRQRSIILARCASFSAAVLVGSAAVLETALVGSAAVLETALVGSVIATAAADMIMQAISGLRLGAAAAASRLPLDEAALRGSKLAPSATRGTMPLVSRRTNSLKSTCPLPSVSAYTKSACAASTASFPLRRRSTTPSVLGAVLGGTMPLLAPFSLEPAGGELKISLEPAGGELKISLEPAGGELKIS